MAKHRAADEISCMGYREQDDDSVSQASAITLKTYVSRRQIPIGNHPPPKQPAPVPAQAQPVPMPVPVQAQPVPVQAPSVPKQSRQTSNHVHEDAKTEVESMLHSRAGARGPHWTRWARTARSDLYSVPKGHPFLPKEVVHLYTGKDHLDVAQEKWISLDDYNQLYKAYRQAKNDEPANKIKQRLSQKFNEATQIEPDQQSRHSARQPVNIEPEPRHSARQPVNIEPDQQSRRSARQPVNIEPDYQEPAPMRRTPARQPVNIEPEPRHSARQPVNIEPDYQEPTPMRRMPTYRHPTLYEPEIDPDDMAVALPARHSSQQNAMQPYIPSGYAPARQSVPSGVGTMSLSRGSASRASHLQIYGTDIEYEHKDADGSTFKIRVKNN
jgi:hypothetical protein